MEKPRPEAESARVAIVDNSIDPSVYKPIEHWRKHLQAPWEAFRAPEGRLPEPARFTHIILTGSEASILEPGPWADAEIEFVREAVDRGLAVLGSCYGHQLLALALAGPDHVGRCRRPEIGWIPVEIPAASPALGRPGTAYSFSFHFDEVRALPSARFEILAGTEICPIQAFGLPGRKVWGFQIHPEIDLPDARALLQATLSGRGKGWELCREALGEKPRDSGLISVIAASFLTLPLDFE